MRRTHAIPHVLLSCALTGLLAGQAAQAQSGLLSTVTDGANIGSSVEKLLVDYSNASVSAASLAGVGGSAPTVVENLRDVSLALKGDTPLSRKLFALSVTPSRTDWAFPRVSLADYKKNISSRLIASTTVGYAQGESTHEKVDFRRRAWSIETSAFFDPKDDPVVVVANRDCAASANTVLTSPQPTAPQPTASGAATLDNVTTRDAAKLKAALKAYDDCADKALAEANKRWNKSRWSVSIATGWIQRADGTGPSERLGTTLAAGVVYGFDHVPVLRENAAWTLLLRRNSGEPVLKSLVQGPLQTQNNTLWATRLSGGSPTFRGVIELSDKRQRAATTSELTFTRAFGVDLRVMDGLWLNLRSGKQRKIDGNGEEIGSLVTLSYSPSASLKR
jgi:hypothetical protein